MTPVQTNFQQALAAHARGAFAEAEAICQKILAKRQPRDCDALHLMGVIAVQSGRCEAAIQLIGKAIAAAPSGSPGNAVFYSNRANAFRFLKNFAAALQDFDRAAALRPNLAEVHCNRGATLVDLERFEDALAAYEKAIALDPYMAVAHQACSSVLAQLKRRDEALTRLDRAIALRPALPALHFDRGNLLAEGRQPEAAVAAYDKAVALQPDFAAAHFNRANALFDLKQLDAALAGYDRALTLWPQMAQIHYGRGNTLYRLGRFPEAIVAYDRTIALKPDFVDAQIARGDTLLKLERREDALVNYDTALKLLPRDSRKTVIGHILKDSEDHASILALADRSAALNVREEIAALAANATLPAARAQHDLDQAGYLMARGETDPAFAAAQSALRAALDRSSASDPDAETAARIALSAQEVASVGRFLELRPRAGDAAVPEHCLNPANDWAAIEAAYFARTPEIVVIDDFLSSPALLALREFCRTAAVWKVDYGNGYLGAFMEDGFMSPLHLRIAQDLRARMPRIFGAEALEQLWGFKYGAGRARGINVHADFAKVNLNFWITPDEANLDPTTGGMIIYDVPSPPSWSFDDYNKEPTKIYAFLKENNASRQKVAHRCNRAVLFNSSLFHETDEIHFKDGYENRRINVTYLFGNQGE